MNRKAAELETEAAEIGLLASGGNGPSQQVNTPTITTTTTDVCGSTPDPVEGGEKELGSQNDVEFNLEDEEALKSKGTPPASNWSASSKDSLQDQTDQNDTYISNYDETSGDEGDEPKKADLVMENNRLTALHKRKISQRQSKDKRRRSHEHKGVDFCDSMAEKELGIQNDGEFNLGDEEALKSKGTPLAINLSAGSKDSLQDQTDQNYNYISNYDETRGHKRDELKEADLGMEKKRVQWRSLPEKMSAFSDELSHLYFKGGDAPLRSLGFECHSNGRFRQSDGKRRPDEVCFNSYEMEALGHCSSWKPIPGSEDFLQDQTENDTYIINNDKTTEHERYDNYVTKGDELREADHHDEHKVTTSSSSSMMPNPGMKRPPVTVIKTAPPPPPPT